MASYDLVLFGVTGYTGTKILEALLDSTKMVNFAVAGRNESRLQELLCRVGERKNKDISNLPVIIADSNNDDSLVSMAKQAKVIINIVGPYRLYGESVVKACIEGGASYVDVCGEPAFLELMHLKYSDAAKKKGIYIVGSCGFDSVPCDLGISFLKEHFGGRLNHVETFIELKAGPAGFAVNTGTYDSLILSIANSQKDNLRNMRRFLMPDKLPRSGFFPPKRGFIWYHKEIKAYCLAFLGADKSVVARSQYFNQKLYGEFPAIVQTYIAIKSLLWASLLILWLSIFAFLTRFEFTRKLLQRYPEISSFNLFKSSGPTKDQVENSSFIYWFYGSGWNEEFNCEEQPLEMPNKQVKLRCDGPDPYIATAACALSAALILLEEAAFLPKSGGVFTPGTALKRTSIYDRLQKYGITYKIV